VENVLLLDSVRMSVSSTIFAASADGESTDPDAAGCGLLQSTDTWARHGEPAGTLFIVNWVAQRVTSPEPLGNGIPEMASSTEDFPELWSPITAI
jgi:hypothetical protein